MTKSKRLFESAKVTPVPRRSVSKSTRVSANRHAECKNGFRYEKLEDRQLLASWSPLNNSPPASLGTMLLQTDGTVLAHGAGESREWYRLTPDASGSYLNGTWSNVASMSQTRLYYGSNVLPDGRTIVVGGEYSSAGGWTNTGEIYNPQNNTWTAMADFPEARFGDGQTVLLPNGKVIAGDLSSTKCYIFDPATNSWSPTGSKIHGDRNNEETWTLLPDGDVLSYDIFSSESTGIPQAQRYDFATGTWIDAGTLPDLLSDGSIGYEIGAALRLPDGRIFQIGGNSHTALFDPTLNTWVAGPEIPGGRGADDAPAALMPNGHVLMAVDTPLFQAPTRMMEYDPIANTISDITSALPTNLQNQLSGIPSYRSRMLILPTGEMMFSPDGFSGNSAYIYSADGGPSDSARPTIATITLQSPNVFTITGTQLTGQSAGASYGDDAEMDTNFPVIQLTATDGSGKVYYARSFNWTPGVGTGNATVTSQFSIPATVPQGVYALRVIASGIASAPFTFNTSGNNSATGIIGETGNISVSSSWKTVPFTKTYFSPVVIAGPASLNGSDPLTVRIRNVTKTSFQIALDEWDYRDGIHGNETVSYMVMEAGSYVLSNGTVIQAGTTTANHRWSPVAYSDAQDFTSAPVVFAQITTYNEIQAASTRLSEVSNSGFRVRIQEEQASDFVHKTETVSWIAISKGAGTQDGLAFEAKATPNEVTHLGYSVDFESPFAKVPTFFANMQTYNGGDPANVRSVRTNRIRSRIFLEEERSYDNEIRHNPEVVGYFAIEPGQIVIPPVNPIPLGIKAPSGLTLAEQSESIALDQTCDSTADCICAACLAGSLEDKLPQLAHFVFGLSSQSTISNLASREFSKMATAEPVTKSLNLAGSASNILGKRSIVGSYSVPVGEGVDDVSQVFEIEREIDKLRA